MNHDLLDLRTMGQKQRKYEHLSAIFLTMKYVCFSISSWRRLDRAWFFCCMDNAYSTHATLPNISYQALDPSSVQVLFGFTFWVLLEFFLPIMSTPHLQVSVKAHYVYSHCFHDKKNSWPSWSSRLNEECVELLLLNFWLASLEAL